ncbi:MAG: hypothetical protein IPG59_08605 [Candidatus Melainabacteria bacterium]|nr:MAG: hypothetical protein IPG59_08605 [Candidatus Melainabacteria bacterium]
MEVAKLNEVIVRQYVLAGSTDTDSEILESLSEHQCEKMAQDIHTPIAVLQKLATDENGWVREKRTRL